MSSKDHDAIPDTFEQQQQLPNSFTLPQLFIFLLESQIFHGFYVSEYQLCFPEVISKLLGDLDCYDIITACEHLGIKIRPCSPDQLRVMKESKILPEDALSCGLIDYSSAQILYYFVQNVYKVLRSTQELPRQLKIYHTLSSHCDGLYYPDHYEGQNSKCIVCQECKKLTTPRCFIRHSHDSVDYYNLNFTTDKWQEYIHLHEEIQGDILSKRVLNELKFKSKGGFT